MFDAKKKEKSQVGPKNVGKHSKKETAPQKKNKKQIQSAMPQQPRN